MAVQVQEIIDRIKSEGVNAARAEAEKLMEGARAKAAAIVDEAEAKARSLLERAAADAEREKEAGRAALVQASRDTLLLLRKEIERLLAAIIAKEAKEAMGADALKELLPAIVKALGAEGAGTVISLPEADFKRLEAHFVSRLQGELKAGLELRPQSRLKSGFRVSGKDGGAYYDYSAEALAEALIQLLNPALAETMKSAAAGA